jgi:hypothetical protein
MYLTCGELKMSFNKKTLVVVGSALTALLVSFGALANVTIDNGFTTDQQGYWSVVVDDGGESRSAYITATGTPSGTVFENEEIIFDYISYVDTGSGGVRLSATNVTTAANLSDPAEVTSAGTFLGSAGNTIDWTMVSSIDPGTSVMLNTLTLTAQEGLLGILDFYQYLDEDVLGNGDDFFFTNGSGGGGDLQLFTIDNSEAVGVSHSGALAETQGLANSVFTGWAVCDYNNMNPAITSGTQSVALDGVVCGGLAPGVHPIAGAGYGPDDIVSTVTWSVDPAASTATIVTSLGGVPDITEVVDPVNTTPVPTLSGQMLALLVLLLGGVTFWYSRRQRVMG